jgi:hypothetical protein
MTLLLISRLIWLGSLFNNINNNLSCVIRPTWLIEVVDQLWILFSPIRMLS